MAEIHYLGSARAYTGPKRSTKPRATCAGAHQGPVIAFGRANFMAGIALMDDMLREAERLCMESEASAAKVELETSRRGDHPLVLYLLPFVQRPIAHPELAEGFAAAMGDYIGMLQQGLSPSAGDQYTHLELADILSQVKV